MTRWMMTLALTALFLGGPAWAAPDQEQKAVVHLTEATTMETDSEELIEAREAESVSEVRQERQDEFEELVEDRETESLQAPSRRSRSFLPEIKYRDF